MPRELHPLGVGPPADAAGGDDGAHGTRGSLAAGERLGNGSYVMLVSGSCLCCGFACALGRCRNACLSCILPTALSPAHR